MNDPGLEGSIQVTENRVKRQLQAREKVKSTSSSKERRQSSSTRKGSQSRKSDKDDDNEDEEDTSIYQATPWWFASTAFPLFAGSFGPIANLFSVCALVETWRVRIDDGSRVPDPPWLIGMNVCSLIVALVANIVLLFNFARRIRYYIAQPITISLWYLSCILLVIPIGLTHDSALYNDSPSAFAFSQSYYYGLISSILYFAISTLLLMSTLGATFFHKYPASFSTLTGPQRTLMLQTISFSLYLALGAGVFAKVEGWTFTDGVYWADYTLLTVGLGTDFPLTTTLGRMLLIPYAAIGITMIGLVISSVRALVLERAKAKVVRRFLGKERERWKEDLEKRQRLLDTAKSDATEKAKRPRLWMHISRINKNERRLSRQLRKHEIPPLKPEDQQGAWHRAEFELMRFIQLSAESAEQHTALGVSFFVILVVWIGGALIFWSCEQSTQSWSYTEALFFSYTTLLTIGYGDFYPTSFSGKPFFVVWSLISVPAMTVLISNMGDTVIKWIRDATVWTSRWTILPEHRDRKKRRLRNMRKKKSKGQDVEEYHDSDDDDDGNNESHRSENRQRNQDNKGDNADILEQDVEELGGAVGHFEEEEGRPGSLAARIAKDIARLAKDLNAKPPKKYSWAEWDQWLRMLGEREDGGSGSVVDGSGRQGEEKPDDERAPAPPIASMVGAKADEETSSTVGGRTSGTLRRNSSADRNAGKGDEDEDWRWTWLGDQGPLFSRLSETEWLIERLCFRLEKVLEDEIKEARADAREAKNQ